MNFFSPPHSFHDFNTHDVYFVCLIYMKYEIIAVKIHCVILCSLVKVYTNVAEDCTAPIFQDKNEDGGSRLIGVIEQKLECERTQYSAAS